MAKIAYFLAFCAARFIIMPRSHCIMTIMQSDLDMKIIRRRLHHHRDGDTPPGAGLGCP